MSRTVNARTDVGTSDLGNVFVHELSNQETTRFEVRCGNHTIVSTPDKARALRVANALADIPEKNECCQEKAKK